MLIREAPFTNSKQFTLSVHRQTLLHPTIVRDYYSILTVVKEVRSIFLDTGLTLTVSLC